jgi:hypothetical protein
MKDSDRRADLRVMFPCPHSQCRLGCLLDRMGRDSARNGVPGDSNALS